MDGAGGRRYLPPSMSSAPRLRIPPVPALLIAGTSLQGGAALAKQLFPALGPAGASGVRLSFAAVLLFLFFRPRLWRLSAGAWRAAIPYGVALGGMNFSFYLALERIPLGLAVTLEFLGPLGVALYGSRRLSDFAWVVLAGTGIFLLSPWSGGAGDIDPVGAGLALLAGAFWAAYIVLGARTARRLTEVESVTAGMVVATVVVLPFALASGAAAKLTPTLAALGVAVALLASALPYTLEMVALHALPSRVFGILTSLEPVVATLVGWVALGEVLTGTQWLAVGLVCVASAGATWSARSPAPAPASPTS